MDTDEMNLPTGLDEAVNEEHQLVISYYSCVGDGTNQHTLSLSIQVVCVNGPFAATLFNALIKMYWLM